MTQLNYQQLAGTAKDVEADSSAASPSGFDLVNTLVVMLFCGALAAYCLLEVPKLALAPNPTVVYWIAGYIGFLGLVQLSEYFAGHTAVKISGFGVLKVSGFDLGMLGLDFGGRTLPAGFAWLTMEMPSFLVPLAFQLSVPEELANKSGKMFLCMFMAHYFQRSFIYPYMSRAKAGQPMSLFIWAMSLMFTTANGTLQSLDLLLGGSDGFFNQFFKVRPEFGVPEVYLGCGLFAFGMLGNIHSDYILRNLRKPGETGNKVPKGGIFEYISAANLWCECVEFTGYAIASGAFAPCLFAVFCWCGIGVRALKKHEWYLETFGDEYPQNRKRCLPFIW